MSRGPRAPRLRVVFSLLMSVMLLSSMSPLAFAQDATPQAADVPVETEVPTEEPTEIATEEPTEVPTEEATEAPVTEAPTEDVGDVEEGAQQDDRSGTEAAPMNVAEEPLDVDDTSPGAEILATTELYLENTTPLRCEPGYWLFTILPDPGEDVQSLDVTFTNGNTVTLDRGIGNNRANFRTSTNRDSTVASAVAVVPADFSPTAFQITAGPCNDEPVEGLYDVTIVAATNDDGSAEGAGVTITRNDGTVVATGAIGADNTFTAPDLQDGGYTVEIDGWPADYNRVSTDFTVSNADRNVNVSLARLVGGTISLDVGESNAAGGARIGGAAVTVTNIDGDIVSEGSTDDDGKFRTDSLPPSIYTVVVDGSAVGFTTKTLTVSNERGGHIVGVVLELLPDEAAVTITGVTFDGGSAEGAIVSVKGSGSVEIMRGTLDENNSFDAGVLPNGDYSVTVDAYSLGLPYMYGSERFSVAGTPVNVEVPLNDFPTRGSLSGTVRDAETGANLSGVEVVVTEPDGDVLSDVTGSSGRFRITSLTQGVELTITVDAEGYEPFSTTHTFPPTDGSQGKTMVIDLQPITQEVTIVAETSDGGSAEGALVYIDDMEDVVGIVPMAIDPIDGTLDAENSFTAGDLPAGEYTVLIDATEQGYGVGESTFVVPTEGPVVVALELAPTTGMVAVQKMYCEDIDDVTIFEIDVEEGIDVGDCLTGAATFSFYLVGDGTADYQQLQVWEDGFGIIELDAGIYEMVEEGTLATTTIEVVAGEVSIVGVANPGEAPAPRDGTVNLSVFTCSNIDEVVFTSDAFPVTFASLPTDQPECEPGDATFTFYLVGDGTADYTQVNVAGAGSVQLAPGTYEVVEEGTQASTFITVYAGDFVNLDVQIPAGGDVVPGSSVNIAKFYCDTVTETEFLSLSGSDYSWRDELPVAPDCTPGMATFTFYLYGDGTNAYAQIVVDGAGSIGLEPGLYEVVEEETQARFDLEVFEGENTVLTVNNPIPADGDVPGGPDDADDAADDEVEEPGKKGDEVVVTKLPETGSGAADTTGVMALAAAAAAALAGAGALTLRKRQ